MFTNHKCSPNLELFNLDEGSCSLLIAVADIYAHISITSSACNTGILIVSVLPSVCLSFNTLQAVSFSYCKKS